ncbi:MAG TPA: SGNH/GDSL hydrolase family protein [Solirubrobacterales bacterium]|nr:SGNH/GDSL hydrolase family protein [Solirubrobacterales bacterium]
MTATDPRTTVSAYAALGDSFTAGNGAPEGERWADQVAERLRALNPELRYDNLAVDGATSAAVLEQVPAALALRPDLVTVVCGANDVLLATRPDLAGYERRFEEILTRLGAATPRPALLTATAPEGWRFMALRPRTRARMVRSLEELNATTRRVAARHGVPCLEVAGHPGLDDPANFGPDGLHPSARGHARAAAEIAIALRAHFDIPTALEGGNA